MKTQLSRLALIQEYEHSPEWTLFNQETVAAIRNVSLATIERDRWAGRNSLHQNGSFSAV